MSRHALIRYRADRLLRKDFSGLRPRVAALVRSRLGEQGARLDRQDLDACYTQAWAGLYARMLAGEQIDDVVAWLVLVTYRRAVDELRVCSRQDRLLEVFRELAPLPGASAQLTADFAAELDDRTRLREVLEGLKADLSPRERQAAALCYLQGLSRSQAAQRMGLGERRMTKLMDGSSERTGVATKVNALLEKIGTGRWCEEQGSLMRAYAFGILDPEGERHALAHAHLRECPACRMFVLSLRGLATVLPPLPLPFVSSLGASHAAPGRARASGRKLVRLAGSHGASAPLAKLALVVAAALSVGAGMVVLASGAPRNAPRSTLAPASGLAILQRGHAQPRPRRTAHRRDVRHRSTRHRAVGHRRAQGVLSRPLPQPPSSEPAIVTSSPTQPSSQAPAPSEEFGPERASSRRG